MKKYKQIFNKKDNFNESGNGKLKAWIKPDGELFIFSKFLNHQDVLNDHYEKVIKDGWIRIFVSRDNILHITCYDFTNEKFKRCFLCIKNNDDLKKCTIQVGDSKNGKIIDYKPCFKEKKEVK